MKRTLLGLAVTLLAACNPLSNTLTIPYEPGNGPNGVPVTSPSAAPTAAPTAAPSAAPSAAPTTAPTTAPTVAPADGVLTGETKAFLSQNVTSWARLDGTTIQEAGFTLPLALIQATSTDVASTPFSIKLQMPDEIQSRTVLDHISLDYLAGGHPPPGTYDMPHFDVHFYFHPEAVTAAVDCSNKTQPAADRVPAPYMFFPPGNPECVPAMGYHGLNPTSPELAQPNPTRFDKTLILGYYDGKMNFIEPMMSRDYMLKQEGFSMDVPKPAVVDKAGLYPTKLEMRFNAATQAYDVVLKDFK